MTDTNPAPGWASKLSHYMALLTAFLLGGLLVALTLASIAGWERAGKVRLIREPAEARAKEAKRDPLPELLDRDAARPEWPLPTPRLPGLDMSGWTWKACGECEPEIEANCVRNPACRRCHPKERDGKP